MKIGRFSVASALILCGTILSADSFEQALKDGKYNAQLRAFYIDRTYSGAINNNRNSLAVGGFLGYETGSFYNLTLGGKIYSTNFVDIHDGQPRTSASFDPSLFGGTYDSYTYIGELYANYKIGNTNLKIGRQKLDTPLAGADDARMLPNLFEAAVISNTDIKDTTLIAAHVTRESVGTFGNVYGQDALALQSGYGLGYKSATSGAFRDMGAVALGVAGAGTDGVTAVAAIYNGIPNLKLQAWDYYAHDILNAAYLQADYGWNCLFINGVKMSGSAQYINQSGIGDKLAGSVDSNYWGAKLGAKYNDFDIYGAYSQTGSSNGSLMNGGTVSPWGGMPAFTQGMVTRHQFFADTDSWKIGAGYNLASLTNLPITASAYHSEYDIGTVNSYKPGQTWTATESGFDIAYKPTKCTELKLRANYPRDFAPNLDWDEYRLVANYNF